MTDECPETLDLPRLRLLLRRGPGPARARHPARHTLARHPGRLGLPRLRHAQAPLRNGRDPLRRRPAGRPGRGLIQPSNGGHHHVQFVRPARRRARLQQDPLDRRHGVLCRRASRRIHHPLLELQFRRLSGWAATGSAGSGCSATKPSTTRDAATACIRTTTSSSARSCWRENSRTSTRWAGSKTWVPGDYYAFCAGSGGLHEELNRYAEPMRAIYLWLLPDHLTAAAILHARPFRCRRRHEQDHVR